jgi:poly(A) polymerase
VILVRHRSSVVEVATFRTDGKYLDGRRPEAVTFTTAEEDAKRRDFTINGMFLDPIENKVIDYVGGQDDLKNLVLRAIGDPDHRFEEDHLRVLRAIRFAARFDLTVEPRTADAIRAHAPQLKRISPERVADELRRTLTIPESGGDWAWHALLVDFAGLSDVIFRFLGDPPDMSLRRERALVFNGFPAEQPWPFGLCLAAVTLDWRLLQRSPDELIALLERRSVDAMGRAVRQSLRISNEETEEMTGSLEGVGLLLRELSPGIALFKRFLARPTARSSRLLLNALRCHAGAERVRQINERLDELSQMEFAPTPLITGDDLTDAGLMPGPRFKVALDQTYDAQLEGRVMSRKEALELAVRIAKGETP